MEITLKTDERRGKTKKRAFQKKNSLLLFFSVAPSTRKIFNRVLCNSILYGKEQHKIVRCSIKLFTSVNLYESLLLIFIENKKVLRVAFSHSLHWVYFFLPHSCAWALNVRSGKTFTSSNDVYSSINSCSVLTWMNKLMWKSVVVVVWERNFCFNKLLITT